MRDFALCLAVLLSVAAIGAPTRASSPDSSDMTRAIDSLQHEWARIKYDMHDEKAQTENMLTLAAKAKEVAATFPDRPEPLIWTAIITSSAAGLKGGLSALGMASEARDMLEQAERMDSKALDGSALTSLGSLYDQVPGFPIGFGNSKKARQYLERAIAINPDGIDSNFFYGSFLAGQGEYAKAADVLRHALSAPDRPGRADADAGRRIEVKQSLDQVLAKLEKRKRS